MLCTDGVTDQVRYERLSRLLERTTDLVAAVETLLDETLLTGNDNATAVLIRVS
jgi:serine/threonine protein phosphatase PrpC